jgi:subtilisin family serine protease
MKRAMIVITLLLALFVTKPVSAATDQLLVKANLGEPAMNLVCLLEGCQVTQTVNGSLSTYAAGWGTSFSAPMVSGGVDLLESAKPGLTRAQARVAMAQAELLLAVGMGNGRIDLYRAARSACQ